MAQSRIDLVVRETILKNLIVVVLTFLFFPILKSKLTVISPDSIGDFLLIVSIFLVTVSFPNFAFTYEKVNLKSFGSVLLAHTTTFLFLLLTALLLAVMVIAIGIVYPALYSMATTFAVVLYLSIVLYDFWDLYRIQ